MISRNYNLTGMDLSKGPNSDSLWYLQDASPCGPNAVRRRPQFPSVDLASDGPHLSCETSRKVAASWSVGPALSTVTSTGDTNSASGVLYGNINVIPLASTRVGDECFFVTRYLDDGCFLVRWSGGAVDAVASTSAGFGGAAVTASLTSGSTVVTLSSYIATNVIGCKIQFTDSKNHFYTITDQDNLASTLTLSRPVDFTDASTTFNISPSCYLTSNNAISGLTSIGHAGEQINAAPTYPTATTWETSSGGEPAGIITAWSACGHQGRLFVSNDNTIHYSGTEDDVSTRHAGVEIWDENSSFQVATELGTRIEHMVSFNDSLIIFKDVGVCVLRGTVANGDPSRLGARVDVLSTFLECASPRHVINTPQGVILITRHGMFLVTGEGVQSIGQEVWPRISTAFAASTEPWEDRIARSSFLMDNKAYIYYETNANNYHVFAVWDVLTGLWSFRSFSDDLAPGCATSLLGDDSTVTISFPFSDAGTRAIAYAGTEAYGATVPSLTAVGTSSVAYDNPMFMAITSPIIGGGDRPSHVRVRNIWTNAEVGNENDTSAVVYTNLDSSYAFNPFTGKNTSAYTLGSTDENWGRRNISSDAYGWSKCAGVVQVWDGSGSPQDCYLRGLIVEFDESGVSP